MAIAATMEAVKLTSDRTERLDVFLARSVESFSRTKLAELANAGGVLVDGLPRKASFTLLPNMSVDLETPTPRPLHDLRPADIPLLFAFEDEFLMVVDKPRGLATHPAPSLKEPSLVNALLSTGRSFSESGGPFRPGIVHRLDKETTGLLMIAKNDEVHLKLAKAIQEKRAERRYLAWVSGHPAEHAFTVDAPIARDGRNRLRMAVVAGGKNARTHFKVLEESEKFSLVAARLETGRTHQIRVHLKAIEHPVVGDRIYGRKEDQDHALQLHAAYIQFIHPVTGDSVELYSKPPPDFMPYEVDAERMISHWDQDK